VLCYLNLTQLDVKYALFFNIVMKVEFSRQIFEKYVSIKIRENSFSGCRIVPCRRTDRRDEADSRFSQFSNSPRYAAVPFSSQ